MFFYLFCVVLLVPSTSRLLLVTQDCITVLTCANRPSINHLAYKDSPVTHFPRVSHVKYNLYRRIDKLVAADYGKCHTFYNISGVLHTTVYTFLTALPYTVYTVILEPVYIRVQQSFLYILEFRFPDDCFNLFHTLIYFFSNTLTCIYPFEYTH